MTPFEVDLLEDRLREKSQISYLQVMAILSAIQTLAQAVVSGEAKFTKTNEITKTLRDLLFPELRVETEDKAKKTKELVEQEMKRGPMLVQRLDYGKKGKKKR